MQIEWEVDIEGGSTYRGWREVSESSYRESSEQVTGSVGWRVIKNKREKQE